MSSFTSENSPAGNKLLRLVSHGNSIICELLRLSQHLPAGFVNPGRYEAVLIDHSYFKRDDWFEDKIHSDGELLDLDHEFRDNHMEILTRFYLLFESIYKYLEDFKKWLHELDEGFFVQLTLDVVLANPEGKQLVAEAVYLFGTMLLLLDRKIPGVVRERMIVSYYRHVGPALAPLVEKVRDMLGSTGYQKKQPPPADYPERYFARAEMPKDVVNSLISRLRMDDIYSQISAWPIPEHRSTALSTQAAMLYVLLYFVPEVLQSERAIMREIVDKHFADNWIISMYLGFTVDLSQAWGKFKAAWSALQQTLERDNVEMLCRRHNSKIPTCIRDLDHLLTEGVLTEDYVLDSTQKCLTVLRHSNDTIRWLMLHTTTQDKRLRPLLTEGYSPKAMLELFLKTAQFENALTRMLERLLKEKEQRWLEARQDAAVRMMDLSTYFSGNAPLVRCKPNAQLERWFADISGKVEALDYEDPIKAGRKIQQLIQALVEVQQFEEIDTQAQVKQFLEETREQLWTMVRIVNILEDRLIELSIVSDTAYVWQIIPHFIPLMQEMIRRHPRNVLLLRSAFIKLSSLLQQTCVRINQVPGNPDLFSVSAFYSGQLVKFVRAVLEVVPRSIFERMSRIIRLQTSRLLELPSRVEKEHLVQVAAFDDRFELARLTYEIAMFTEGILSMERTLVGIISVDPKALLEDGIRKVLVHNISNAMQEILHFSPKETIEQFEATLRNLSVTLSGYKRSFEYMSDYVAVYGGKIWQEEVTRIFNFFVEQEVSVFLRQEIYFWQSTYWDEAIPIPQFESDGGPSKNFVGRLTRALLSHTNFHRSIYVDSYSSWYDVAKGHRELVGIRTFQLLLESVGVAGVSGIDRLLSFMMVHVFRSVFDLLEVAMGDAEDKSNKRAAASLLRPIKSISASLNPTSVLPPGGEDAYAAAARQLQVLWPKMLESVGRLGQAQLLRLQISNALNYSMRLESALLESTVETLNDAILGDVQKHYANPEQFPFPSEDSELLPTLTSFLDVAGVSDPLTKIYATTNLPSDELPLVVFLFVVAQLPKFVYDNTTLRSLTFLGKKKEWYDFTPMVVGVQTLLKQFHSLHSQQFLGYMGQYVRSLINHHGNLDDKRAPKKRLHEHPRLVANALVFLEEFAKYSYLPRRVIEQYLPPFVLDHINLDAAK